MVKILIFTPKRRKNSPLDDNMEKPEAYCQKYRFFETGVIKNYISSQKTSNLFRL